MSTPELLAPAGDFETALAAFQAGADAVYLGLDAFSARAEAKNLTADELRLLLAEARSLTPPRKVYVTFNTLLDEADLPAAVEKLAVLAELGPDALIVQDLGVARLVRRHFPSLAIHASTQMVAHNLEDVLALKELGFSRVVLAREMTLDEIRSIAQRCGVELEVFVHGALCYSLSGLCLFSAMEKNRSGNRGRCAYCCRLSYADAAGNRALPFSMRDLRLDGCLAGLADAGVASLKIEGRMKSPLYVASVTSYYRHQLDGTPGGPTQADLEAVFSRRTTSLYVRGADAKPDDVIDPTSLGHLGTPVGTLKHVTKDREGRTLIRFHTERALEVHDGLAFLTPGGGVPFGFGVEMMRIALSRRPVFQVPAGSDVEIQVPDERLAVLAKLKPELNPLVPGATVYCSASNAVKRAFPVPSIRPSDLASGTPVDITVTLAPDAVTAAVKGNSDSSGHAACASSSPSSIVSNVSNISNVSSSLPATLTPAKNPDRTEGAVRKAFERMGTTDWRLGALTVVDPGKLFAPPSILNEVRRQLVEKLDDARARFRAKAIEDALKDGVAVANSSTGGASTSSQAPIRKILKFRLDQPLPPDAANYAEIVVAIGHAKPEDVLDGLRAAGWQTPVSAAREGPLALPVADQAGHVDSTVGRAAPASRDDSSLGGALAEPSDKSELHFRLALPVFTHEAAFNALRVAVKRLVKEGFTRWEAADLAGLRLLKSLGVTDITADWTLYAFNHAAAAALAELGVTRFVASPENAPDNLAALAGLHVPSPVASAPSAKSASSALSCEFLSSQSTPLFISLTRPDTPDPSTLTGVDGNTFSAYELDGLWVTARPAPRAFTPPPGAVYVRTDLSWNRPGQPVQVDGD